ncbi:hypothetical protein TrST_g12421 [Triparma strigata]|uniref:peptide-methionine (S)-S-oxide reductase n=1 Tax=Triparma strigata TaxID=1606541 RepID=A0A9W7AM01_9STRA|nr:hypothetical protein TrST_g12421 [Triparma strigata]
MNYPSLVLYLLLLHVVSTFTPLGCASSAPRLVSLRAEKTAIVGAGCFWSPQEHFAKLPGVKEAVSGYCGDAKRKSPPSYASVSSGVTDFVEAVQISYDPSLITYEDLLKEFESVNDSAPNSKRQYKGVIFVQDEEEEEIAKNFVKPNVAIEPATKFWKAEGYHQNYWPKWKLRLPVFLLLLVGSGNPGELMPEVAQQAFFYLYLAALVAAVIERKIDNKVE